jgi:hypothetical protein
MSPLQLPGKHGCPSSPYLFALPPMTTVGDEGRSDFVFGRVPLFFPRNNVGRPSSGPIALISNVVPGVERAADGRERFAG